MSAQTSPLPALQGVDHIHLYVADRAAAQAWYARVLGLQPVAELAVWARDGGPLTLADGAGSVHLALFERPPQACRSTIALRVDASQFLAWRQHLGHELGQAPRAVDHQLAWSLYFADPDGNPFEITTYDYAEAARLLREEAAA